MPFYLTGLITTDYWRFPAFPYSTRHWKLHLLKTPQSEMAVEWSTGSNGPKRRRNGKEIVIEARDNAAADRAAFILYAAAQVLDGDAFLSSFSGRIDLRRITGSGRGRTRLDSGGATPRPMRSHPNIPLECLLAVKTARRRRRIYALTKLWLSYQIFSVDSMDLDPSHSATIPKSLNPLDHVSYTTAITLAYAAMEELELTIRASNKRPSMINGAWNPVVKQELEEQLSVAGIDLAENYHWQVRGPKTRLEKKHPPKKLQPSPWAKWGVRDVEVALVDAIAHVSWLRSKVSAHKMNYDFARALSVYEVANAQYLARRLFLESLGFWRSEPNEGIEADIETRVGSP